MVAKRCIWQVLAAKMGCPGQWEGNVFDCKRAAGVGEGEKSEPLYNTGKCCALLGRKEWIYGEM